MTGSPCLVGFYLCEIRPKKKRKKSESKSPGVSVSCSGLRVIRFILIKSKDSTFRLAQGVLSVSGNMQERTVSRSTVVRKCTATHSANATANVCPVLTSAASFCYVLNGSGSSLLLCFGER